jgi:hypothetical protein
MLKFHDSSALTAVAVAATIAALTSIAAAQPSSYPAEPPVPSNPSGIPRTPPPTPTPPPAASVDPLPAEVPPPEDVPAADRVPPSAATDFGPGDTAIDLNATQPATPAAPAAAEGGSVGLPSGTERYDQPDSDHILVSNRELGGHRFPLAVFVPTALSFTYFGVRAGLEYHRVPGFARDISFFSTGFSRTNLETLNAAETVDVALRLHEYIALLGTAYGLARVGANEQTLLGSGADYTYGGNVGALIKVFRIAGFQLAIRGEAGYFAGQRAGIIGLFQDIGEIVQTNVNQLAQTTDVRTIDIPARLSSIENAIRVATRAILTPFRGVEYGGSLNVAQSLGSAMGLQISFGLFGKAETADIPVFDAMTATITADPRDENKFFPKLAVAFDVDLESSLGIPLDLMAEYTLTQLSVTTELDVGVQERSWTEHLVAVGGYFAGTADLQLGLIGYFLDGRNPDVGANAQPSGEPLDVGAQFVFRYLR